MKKIVSIILVLLTTLSLPINSFATSDGKKILNETSLKEALELQNRVEKDYAKYGEINTKETDVKKATNSVSRATISTPYSFTFDILVSVQSKTITTSNDDISIKCFGETTSGPEINDVYYIYLYRDGLIDDYVGRVEYDKDKTQTKTWTNVGAGKYYFVISKANDGSRLEGDGVFDD